MKNQQNLIIKQVQELIHNESFSPEKGMRIRRNGINLGLRASRSNERSACTLRLRIHLDGWHKDTPEEVLHEARRVNEELLHDESCSYTAEQILKTLELPRLEGNEQEGIELSLNQTLPDGRVINRKAITNAEGIAQFNYLIWDAPCQLNVVESGSDTLVVGKVGHSQFLGFEVSVKEDQTAKDTQVVTLLPIEGEKAKHLVALKSGEIIYLPRIEGNKRVFGNISQGEYEILDQEPVELKQALDDELSFAAATSDEPNERVIYNSPDGSWVAVLQPGQLSQSDITLYFDLEPVVAPKISIILGSLKGTFSMSPSGKKWEGSVSFKIPFNEAKTFIPVITVE